MSDGIDIDTEQVIDDVLSGLSIPESGAIRRNVAVRAPPCNNTPLVTVQVGIPTELAREIIDEAEERIDLRRRGKVGEAIVNLDNETWELKIEGDSI